MRAGAMLDRGWWCGCLCRSREGSDVQMHKAALKLVISIHAPAKGATKEITGEDYNK